jgi:hypothetical protein
MTVSLHVASSEDAVYGALTAMNEGAEVARKVSTREEFKEKVATAYLHESSRSFLLQSSRSFAFQSSH